MKRLTLAPIFICVLLCGCATGYHSSSNLILGMTGGYTDTQGPGELVQVNFDGNGFIDKSKVGIYLLYRCAELAKEHNQPYFTVYPTVAHAIADKPVNESVVFTIGGKPSGEVY